MNKPVKLTCADEAWKYLEALRGESAVKSKNNLRAIMDGGDSLNLLYKIKFNRIGYDPLSPGEEWNLVEQMNQTFTYWASFKAAILLFQWHAGLDSLSLNLGTAPGFDIESEQCGGIVAEVFAAVSPSNNQKQKEGIGKVSGTSARHKYVFFMCPSYDEKCVKKEGGVMVYSVGVGL